VKTIDVRGGTNLGGVQPEIFAMPPGMAIRYDKPCAALTDLITGYHVYRSSGPESLGQVDRFLPGTANVRFTIDAGPVSVSIGRRTFADLPPATLYGPTGTALKAITNGGIMIGFGVSALAWSRLFRRSAGDYCNKIVPLGEAMGPIATGRFMDALRLAACDDEVAPALDTILCDLLGPPPAEAALIGQLSHMIGRDGSHDVATVAAELGITGHALRRISVRHFGFTPKMLLRRARFLRSFLRLFRTPGTVDYSLIDPSYFDMSHFLRDADTFLGMTPRRFMASSTPFLDASVRARAAVLGAATQVLHVPSTIAPIGKGTSAQEPQGDAAPRGTPAAPVSAPSAGSSPLPPGMIEAATIAAMASSSMPTMAAQEGTPLGLSDGDTPPAPDPD